MRTKGVAVCCVCICQHGCWQLACLVVSMSAGACLHVLRVRYLRVGLDIQGTLGNCTLLFAKPSLQYLISAFLSTFPQVTASMMGVGDALSQARPTGLIQ